MPLPRRFFLQSVLVAPSLLAARAFGGEAQTGKTVLFENFEDGWGDWTTSGTAFGARPATDTLFPGKITGFNGRGFVCTLSPRSGNAAFGKAVSREFVIEKPFITFKIGGGHFPSWEPAGQASLNLVVDGAVERSTTGDNTARLSPGAWDVSPLIGKKAHLEIVDATASNERGYLLVDDIAFADTTTAADATDAFVQEKMAAGDIPAVTLMVSRWGAPGLFRAYGMADREKGIKAAVDTPFRIASISKQFFAAAILLLAQDKKLTLDDPVSQYIKDAPASWSAITIRHLLSHTSGLVREGPLFRPAKMQPDIDIVRSGFPLSLVFAPGEKWQYSNLGYFTIAEIIRIVSGVPWGTFIKERIFRPANMTKTCLTSDPAPDRAVGYDFRSKDGTRVNERDVAALRPSGAFLSTPKDMAKWDALLYRDTLLNPESRRQWWTPTRLNNGSSAAYGLGWEVKVINRARRVEHSGGQPGFVSDFLRGLDDGLSVLVLTNSDKGNATAIAREIARLHSSA